MVRSLWQQEETERMRQREKVWMERQCGRREGSRGEEIEGRGNRRGAAGEGDEATGDVEQTAVRWMER